MPSCYLKTEVESAPNIQWQKFKWRACFITTAAAVTAALAEFPVTSGGSRIPSIQVFPSRAPGVGVLGGEIAKQVNFVLGNVLNGLQGYSVCRFWPIVLHMACCFWVLFSRLDPLFIIEWWYIVQIENVVTHVWQSWEYSVDDAQRKMCADKYGLLEEKKK